MIENDPATPLPGNRSDDDVPLTRDPWRSLVPGEALSCIVCDRALDNWCDAGNQPEDGLAFFTHGHYPSSLFDAMGNGHLEITVCEECLLKKAAKQVAFVPPRPRRSASHLLSAEETRELFENFDFGSTNFSEYDLGDDQEEDNA